jgi:hypothetical protein
MPIGLQIVLFFIALTTLVMLMVILYGVSSALALMLIAIRRYYDTKTEILQLSSWEKGKLTHL